MSTKSLKIFFNTMDAAGHMFACIGFAQAIQQRGHQVSFLSDLVAFKAQLQEYGFREIELKQAVPEGAPSLDDEQAALEVKKKMMEGLLKSGLLSDLDPMGKLLALNSEDTFLREMANKCIELDGQIKEILEQEKPDLVIVDNFMVNKCIIESGIPWVYIFSGNPLFMLNDERLPPHSSGFSTDGSNKHEWAAFREASKTLFADKIWNHQMRMLGDDADRILQDNPELRTFAKSKYLNVYGYPEELDYDDIAPRPDNIIRVDAFARQTPAPYQLPDEFGKKVQPGDKLIFLSMGSMGCLNVDLMKRLIDLLKDSPHKFIVSKGPRADEIELPENMWGDKFLPQTQILPLVDLVITHGGNNTLTETFVEGKPMIVMPLFADQFDNAQRIQEKGYGLRMNGHRCTKDELNGAIDKLLADEELKAKLAKAKTRIANSNSKEKAVIRLEQLVEKHGGK